MRVLKFAVNIGDDHTVHLELPADVLRGPAEVIVQIPEDTSEDQPNKGMADFLESLRERSWPLKSKEEIDAELRAERDSWREP